MRPIVQLYLPCGAGCAMAASYVLFLSVECLFPLGRRGDALIEAAAARAGGGSAECALAPRFVALAPHPLLDLDAS